MATEKTNGFSDIKELISEFKPSIIFVVKFLSIYLVLNILYGLYIESFNGVDPITHWVTVQSAEVIGWFYSDIGVIPHETKPNTLIYNSTRFVLSVYEGCNGVNVVIVFVSFILAFRGAWRRMLWFIPLGIIIIHLANISRIVFLYWVSESLPNLYYFSHKYLFTAVIYVVVFVLWYVWVSKLSKTSSVAKT